MIMCPRITQTLSENIVRLDQDAKATSVNPSVRPALKKMFINNTRGNATDSYMHRPSAPFLQLQPSLPSWQPPHKQRGSQAGVSTKTHHRQKAHIEFNRHLEAAIIKATGNSFSGAPQVLTHPPRAMLTCPVRPPTCWLPLRASSGRNLLLSRSPIIFPWQSWQMATVSATGLHARPGFPISYICDLLTVVSSLPGMRHPSCSGGYLHA